MARKPANIAIEVYKPEFPEPNRKWEDSIDDYCADIRNAAQKGMTPRAWEGSIWDKLDDRAMQKKLDQQARKSKALATWR